MPRGAGCTPDLQRRFPATIGVVPSHTRCPIFPEFTVSGIRQRDCSSASGGLPSTALHSACALRLSSGWPHRTLQFRLPQCGSSACAFCAFSGLLKRAFEEVGPVPKLRGGREPLILSRRDSVQIIMTQRLFLAERKR